MNLISELGYIEAIPSAHVCELNEFKVAYGTIVNHLKMQAILHKTVVYVSDINALLPLDYVEADSRSTLRDMIVKELENKLTGDGLSVGICENEETGSTTLGVAPHECDIARAVLTK